MSKDYAHKICYSCGANKVAWDSDIDASDIDVDQTGIIHYFHCQKCGARISVFVPFRHKISGYYIQEISHSIADDFLQRHHYLAQQGNGFLGKVQYGLFTSNDKIIGCLVFAGISVIETLIGAFEGFERFSNQEGFWELTRLAMDDDCKEKNLTSWFVARCIKKLRKNNQVRAIISYADSKYHQGYIYQATNFKYYGLAPQKSDFFEKLPNGKERQVWRGSVKGKQGEWRERSRKHRYMIVYDKTLKIQWKEEPYPKGDNTEYELQEKEVQMNIFDMGVGKYDNQ